MFIKVIRYSVVKERNENGHCVKEVTDTIVHLYEVNDFTLWPVKPEEQRNTPMLSSIYEIKTNYPLKEIVLCMKEHHGENCWEATIPIPIDSDTEVTEIYIMNDNGKTIQKYIF